MKTPVMLPSAPSPLARGGSRTIVRGRPLLCALVLLTVACLGLIRPALATPIHRTEDRISTSWGEAQVASDDHLLKRGWDSYKARFLEGGRIVERPSRRTTSEGQSYALLRAVYMDDRRTFDNVWSWTREKLQVRKDGLFAWHWAEKGGVVDDNAAADADEDIALALLFAARRWGQAEYHRAAERVLRGIWDRETVGVNGRRVLLAGNWARGGDRDPEGRLVVNPSYFAPYAYRIFAEADRVHRWMDLVDSSYAILEEMHAIPELGGPAGLAPDWMMLDPEMGSPLPADTEILGERAGDFSYDASRLLFRLAVDWLWFKDDRARGAVERLSLPRRRIEQDGRLVASYRPDGTPGADYEALSMYATTVTSLLVNADRELPRRVYAERISSRYKDGPEGAFWGDPDNYYDQNWAWFATALVNGGFANLWAGETVISWEAARAE